MNRDGNFSEKKILKQTDKVVEYILTRETGEFEALSVESVARAMNKNRTRLWRCFKREKGMTLEEYIIRVKLNQAAILLQTRPDLTVKEIGEKVGYYCYDYFIRVFREYFGTTPGKYRDLKMRAAKDADEVKIGGH